MLLLYSGAKRARRMSELTFMNQVGAINPDLMIMFTVMDLMLA